MNVVFVCFVGAAYVCLLAIVRICWLSLAVFDLIGLVCLFGWWVGLVVGVGLVDWLLGVC